MGWSDGYLENELVELFLASFKTSVKDATLYSAHTQKPPGRMVTSWSVVYRHQLQRYILRYTNLPEDVAASYIEAF